MNKRLTQKQETFCLKYFELGNATEAALIAGYSPKTARSMAAQNLTKLNISARLQELRQIVEDATIADVKERKQILSEIARGKVTDFVECGADGSYINIGLESCNSHAIQEVTSTTKYDDKGADAAVITRLKLNSPVQAIDALNKMDGAYAPEKHAHLVRVEVGDLTDEQLIAIASSNGNNPGKCSRGASEEAAST